jgi:ABC-type multidrug transport system fused ATPase/permease subunit
MFISMPSFQKIIDILSNAFCILDFSYIVSGGFTLGIVLFDLHYHYYEFFIRNISITIVCGIFLAYICGLSSWIIGRLIRKMVQNTDKDFEETYDGTMNALASNALSLSVSDKKLAYSYMWIELHKKEEAKEQIIFMNRMWVMQAVFEGLIFSFIVAIGVLIDLKWGLNKDISWLEFIVIFAVLLSSVWLSAIEARRYARTQIREVILSYYSYCC